jgi:hypothetical protein
MTRNQILGTVGAVAAALALGIVVTLVVTNGDDTDSVSTQGTRASTTTTTAAPVTQPPSTDAPTTVPVTGPPTTPPTAIVIPPDTLTPTNPPTNPPTVPPTEPPTVPPTEPPSGDPGITDTEIRLAVIADSPDSGAGVQAWADAVNAKKGVGGRKVALDPFLVNGDPSAYAEAVNTACEQDFAIVGSLSAGDSSTGGLIDCGIPNLPARALSSANAGAPNTFAVVPTKQAQFQVGGFRWLADEQDGCCRQYVIRSTNAALANRTIESAQAAVDAAGFTDAGGTALADDAPQSAYAPGVTEMKADDATFGRSDLPFTSTINFRKEAAAQDLEGVTWFCLAQCYVSGFPQQGGSTVDGTFVQISITPFEDAGSVPAVKRYLNSGGPRNEVGVESAAAGGLFQTAVNKVYGPDKDKAAVTRAAVLQAVSGISAYNAGGLIGTTNVGGKVPNGCFVMMRVDGTGFTRAHPTTAGQLDCGAGNLTGPLGP